MIFLDFAKAITQLTDPRFQGVLWRGVGLTIGLLVAIYAGVIWIINLTTADGVTLPIIGKVMWLDSLLSWGSLGLMIVMSVFLMIPVASAITSLFLDEVAEAVEHKHYATLPPVPPVTFWDGLRDSISFLGVLISANILAFGLYIILPFLVLPIFYALNGFLLGREYFQVAAMRREGREGARALRKKHSGTIWIAGCMMAVPLSIPLVNLVIPILGAATFTHLYHRLSKY